MALHGRAEAVDAWLAERESKRFHEQGRGAPPRALRIVPLRQGHEEFASLRATQPP
jgi:hypothetical protein